MPVYTVKDNETGKTVKFEWNDPSPPTDADMEEVFASVRESAPETKLDTAPTEQAPPEPPPAADNTPEWAGKHPNLYGLLGAGKEVARFAGEGAALVGGAIAGAPLGPAGSIAGAGLAYGGVKQLERMVEGEEPSAERAIKDVAEGAVMEGGGQIIGKYGSKLIGKILAPNEKRMTPEALYNEAKSSEVGVELTPAEVTGSKKLALFESLFDKSPFSADVINDWRELNQLKPLLSARQKLIDSGGGKPASELALGSKIKQQIDTFLSKVKVQKEEQLNAARDNVLKKLGSDETYESLAQDAKSILEERSAVARQKKNELYAEVGKSIPPENITPVSLQETAQKHLDRYALLPNQDGKMMSILRWAARSETGTDKKALLEQIKDYAPDAKRQIMEELGIEDAGASKQSWETLQDFRKQLNELVRGEDLSLKHNNPNFKGQITNEGRVYSDLRAALDKDLRDIAEKTGGEAYEKLRIADTYFKDEYAPLWKNKTIRSLAYTHPASFVDALFRPKNIGEIENIKKAVGVEAFGKLKAAFVNRLTGVGKDEVFSPSTLAANLKKYGEEYLGKVFDRSEIQIIRELASDGRIHLEQRLVGHHFLRGLANETPSVVVDSILGSAERFPGSKTVMKNVSILKAVVDAGTMGDLRQIFAERLFKPNVYTGYIQPERLAKDIANYERVLRQLYSPEEVKWLKQIGHSTKNLAQAERMAANPSGTAQNIIIWGTLEAIIRNPVKGTMTALAPKAMAKIYLSPTGRKLFTRGLVTPADTKGGIELFSKLSALAGIQEDQPEE